MGWCHCPSAGGLHCAGSLADPLGPGLPPGALDLGGLLTPRVRVGDPVGADLAEPEFDNDLTVYGPEVKCLVRRYLAQMIEELGAQSDPDDPGRALLESVELIVPHQANKPMILTLADKAGLSADQLYFNIEMMGNVSAASIPIAVHDAVRDGVITRPTRIFAPGFGAGAVGGYTVMRIDPAIVADEVVLDAAGVSNGRSASVSRATGTTTDDVRVAFGE